MDVTFVVDATRGSKSLVVGLFCHDIQNLGTLEALDRCGDDGSGADATLSNGLGNGTDRPRRNVQLSEPDVELLDSI